MTSQPRVDPTESRWPATVAILAVGGLYLALPRSLVAGPRWLLPILVGGLLVPALVSHQRKNHELNAFLGHLLAAVLTVFMVWSLVLLVVALPAHKEPPV